MNVHASPIGIFDSGLGGLSVAIELEKLLPHERLLYAADSKFCPYGSRSDDDIRWRSLVMANELVDRGAKLLVIACNTATAFALELLRETFSIPIIGLEPALKPAVASSRNRRVGVLATPRTASSERMQRLLDRYADDAAVHVIPAPGFVELVEDRWTTESTALALVKRTISPLIYEGVDTVVLGCTHYPFLRGMLQQVFGDQVLLVDSGAAIARRVQTVLASLDLAAATTNPGDLEIMTTGDIDQVAPVVARLLNGSYTVGELTIRADNDYDAASFPPKLSAACTSSASAGA